MRMHDAELVLGVPGVDPADDSWLSQKRGSEEAVGTEHDGKLEAQHLQRDLAVVLKVLSEIDGGHTALAEPALDAVAVGEGGGELGGDVSLGRWSAGAGWGGVGR